MGLPPQDSARAQVPSARKRQGPAGRRRWPVRLAVVAGLGVAGFALADRLAGALYRQWQWRLAAQVSRVMGHPLELGAYGGLRPWGLEIGPSRFRPGPDNPSTLTAERITASLDPFASLREGVPVLQLQLRGASARLRPNSQGALWQLGHQRAGAKPPRLGLEIRLSDPAKVRLEPSGVALALQGHTSIWLQRRGLDLTVQGRLLGPVPQEPAGGGAAGTLASRSAKPSGPSQFALVTRGHWQRQQWAGQLSLRQIPIGPLLPLLPRPSHGLLVDRLTGRISGRLGFSSQGLSSQGLSSQGLISQDLSSKGGSDPLAGKAAVEQNSTRDRAAGTPAIARKASGAAGVWAEGARCQGGLTLSDLRWRPPLLPAPLTSEHLELHCQDSGQGFGRQSVSKNNSPAQQLVLAPSAVAMAGWRGQLQGALGLAAARRGQLDLRLAAEDPKRRQALQAHLVGPWRHPTVTLAGSLPLPAQPLASQKSSGQGTSGQSTSEQPASAKPNPGQRPGAAPPLSFRGQLSLDGRRGGFRLGLPRLELRSGSSLLALQGQLWPQLELTSQQLRLGSELSQAWPALKPVLGASPLLVGQLKARGTAAQPELRLDLAQASNPLLGSVQTKFSWAHQLLRLESLQAPGLQATGTLPVRLAASGRPALGDLNLSVDLSRYPLERLTPLVGARLTGQLTARGRIRGPLQTLRPELALGMDHPGAGPLDLDETWDGTLGPNRDLRLQARRDATTGGDATAGVLVAQLDRHWLPEQVRLSRGAGRLTLAGSPRRYHWTAQGLPLDGLSLRLPQAPAPLPLRGRLSGQGALELQPLAMVADVELLDPALPGLPGRQLQARGRYRAGDLTLKGEWLAKPQGQVAFQLRRHPDGALWSRLEGRNLGSDLLQNLRLAWTLWHHNSHLKGGAAQDLGTLAIDTLGASLSEQLAALALAKQRLNSLVLPGITSRQELALANLQALVDADLTLSGPSPARLAIDLEARGHLWLREQTMDRALGEEPFIARLQGPLQQGQGRFSFSHLPLALLALIGPVPAPLTGGLAASGRYRLGGPRPLLWADLLLENGRLGDQPLALERGSLALKDQALALDFSLRSQGASNSVDLKGRIPLESSRDGLELRLASRGDGLRFLTALAGKGLSWTSGSADLQLLVRGSVAEPIANGFLRCRDGSLTVAGQAIRDLQAMVLFDFQDLDLQQLTARVGSTGQLSGSGQLPLFEPGVVQRPLKLTLRKAPFSVPLLSGISDGEIELAGSLRRPELRGELAISQGAFTVKLSSLASEAKPGQAVTVPQLVEQGWDFQRPLQVFSSDQESNAGRSLRAAVPNLPMLGLRNLRLRFGPNLRVVVPTVANFNTKGLLTLNGHLDSSLQASGVVRLLSGRLSLFTTTFNLDPDAPNVAVFTPSLGLMPYLDIAMRTRVSDSRSTPQGDRSSIYDWAQAGTPGSFDQLNLIKVVLKVSGPADRLAESLQIRSTPPMSQERLVGLIGGNSLAGLSDGNAGAALATVLGQSLLSPLVSSLSDVMGQRFSFALYPTYVVPASQTSPGGSTGTQRIPSQLVLGSEIGVDLSERFNASVLAAPNRSDIPPQMTLRYQASDRLGVQGSLDSQGRWQTQLQLYYRF